MTPRAIVSVHDVMPETFDGVLRVLSLLEGAQVPPPTLLVVPGKEWTPELLRRLQGLATRGYPLAGHGWIHKAPSGSRTLFHRAHSLLISRNEAEHLSRTEGELVELITRCFEWFPSADLPTPSLYVPPAWAMGSLRIPDLSSLPFRWYEVLSGFVEGRTGRIRGLPLVGFEADTTFRKMGLRIWNRLNVSLAKRAGVPVRISIHPGDLDLLLGVDMESMVAAPWKFIREEEVMAPSSRREDET